MTEAAPRSPSSGAGLGEPLVEVRDLHVVFPTRDGVVRSVDGLSFDVEAARTLGIVGESGSGKSVTGQALLGLHTGTRAQLSGSILFEGRDLVTLPKQELRRLRGGGLSMIFQDPMSALHPYYSVGRQIAQAYRVHHDISRPAARRQVTDMLDRVGIANASRRFDEYPHQYSGGMRQRAMIAMALVNEPRLLIADEPTTALDVTVQAQILDLLRDIQEEYGTAIIMITHDLGVVAEIADDVMVMYAGKAVERGSVDDVFYRAEMPYTWGLLQAMPRGESERRAKLATIPGSPPSMLRPPSGCPFHPRCAFRPHVEGTACVDRLPLLEGATPAHVARCHIPPAERQELFRNEVSPSL
jgi:peptide/nickel transport system ATP-binding protein